MRRPASSLSPTTHFASSQESTVRGRHSSPRTSGQSRSGPREFAEDASERSAFCAIHPYSLSLHLHRYVDCAVGAACTASGGVAHAAQPVSLAHAHNSTRLRDSVRQATSQVQRRSRDVGGSPERPCLARGDCCPPGKGCNRAGPSSRDEAGVLQPLLHRTQERWWPSANPGSASLEPGFAQAPVQDADAQAHDQMHSAPGLVCSDRPEGRLLAFSLSAVPATAVGQARASPHGQHCGSLVYQPAGGIRSHRMSQLTRHLLLWSHTQFKSLRAVHIPGQLNRAADALSRQLTFPGEWRLHPETIRLIWSRFGEAQVDLFASPESSHCQLYFSLTEGPLGTDALAHSWPRALRKYAFPPVSLLVQTLCKLREGRGAGPAGCAPLAHPDLVSRTHFPRDSTSLAHSSEEGPPFSGARHHMAPASRSMEPPCVAPGRDAADLSGLPPSVVETIIQARAPSTRQTYALKWSLFATWCSSQREDPRRCTIGVVLSFLQERLERRLSPSTLKVYVAAIAAHHDAVDGRSLGKHDLIVRFLKGARRMNPSRPPLVPSWDLSIVLAGLQRGPFEPLDSVELKFLSLKTALLTGLTSIKRVGDLQAFSVSEECLVFGPVYSHVVLRPRPGYVPKVPTTPFRDQVVNLQALPSEEADPALALLCPVRALRIYVTHTRSVRSSEQLFVCHGGQQKGKAVSKQRLAHWIVEAVALAYQSQGEPCPLGVRSVGVLPPPMRWRTVPLWQTSAELRAGRHRTPLQDSTIFALSQFLPVYWVSNGREELAGVTLAAPFPLTRGYERLFLPQFSSPDGEPWWNPPSTPGSQPVRSSLTPGPVLVLARPGLRSAPVLG